MQANNASIIKESEGRMTEEEITGRAKGGKALAASMTQEELKARASKAASVRWQKRKTKAVSSPERRLPVALYKGALDLLGEEIPATCSILGNVSLAGPRTPKL